MAERKSTTARSDLEQMLVDETADPRALPLSLLEDITRDFSHAHEIGRGGFAVVYKGILGNRAVAVKRMSNAFMDEMEFHREVECLMRVKHKNVVRFLGYCANRQGTMETTYGNKLVMADVHQRLLCFEYIPQGSLDKYIIDAHREWGTCYRIIKGICEGLQYLHENNVIHLDLKPANILLGNNMVPKITDFGLSRCFDENQSRHITKTIFGTLGYLAPELLNGGVIARSADLYSLGVIIMEILTGQKGYQDIGDVLVSWNDRLERSRQDTLCEQIRVCYEIALECIHFSPKKRPASARNIIDRLHEMTSVQNPGFANDELATIRKGVANFNFNTNLGPYEERRRPPTSSASYSRRENGKNALHFAARQGHVEIVKSLLVCEAQLARRTDKKGQTALHMAVKGTSAAVVRALVNADPAIVMLPDKNGNLALHVATRKKRSEIVNELLLLPDMNVNALNRERKTAFDIAEGLPLSEESAEIKDCLSRAGAMRANDLYQKCLHCDRRCRRDYSPSELQKN